MTRQSKTLACSLFVVSLITILAYFPAFRGPFIFDDVNVIANDTAITSFPPKLQWLNPASRPLVGLTFSLNYHVGGLDPWGFHFVNVVLHIGCGWLIAGLARAVLIRLVNDRLGKDECSANSSALGVDSWVFLLTAFWMLHPLSSSAAAYIVQRSEILAACAIVGFQIAIIRDSTASHRRWQWLAAAIFVVGMNCKVNTVSALPIALLLDRFLLSGSWREVFRRRGLLYLVPVLLGVVAFLTMLPALRRGEAGVGFAEEIPTVPIYLATQSRVLWHYLALCVWPNDLCIDYRWPPVESLGVAIPWIVSSLGLLAVGTWLYIRGSLLGWLMLSVFLLVAPTSTIIPVTDIALDHRMYLATAAVIACLMVLVRAVVDLARLTVDVWFVWSIAGFILIAMFLRTNTRAADWGSGFDLWRSAVLSVPHNPRALQNLTNAADQEGRRHELLSLLESLRATGHADGAGTPAVASRLAEELMKSGRQVDVEPLLVEAIKGLRPTGPIDERQEHAAARVNLGLLLLQRGQLEMAQEQFKLGLVSDPKQAFAHAILGDLAYQRSDYEVAIYHFGEAVASNPNWEQAKLDLGKAKAAFLNGTVDRGAGADALQESQR